LHNLTKCEIGTFGYSAGALFATILLYLQKHNFENTIDFSKNLYAAENVQIFPGELFTGQLPFIRVVISCENAEIKKFLVRFIRFCR
jgi:aspartate/methionine/tyrosine aminotransferase